MRFLFICIFCFLTPLFADLARLEDLTGQWMALRLERAREADAWKEEEARLRLELSLLADAEQRLQEELTALREDASDTETEQAELLEELRERQEHVAPLLPALRMAEAVVRDHAGTLPPSLGKRIESERMALDAAGEEPLPRLRAVLTLLNQMLHLQTELHAGTDIIALDGQRREMEILWIGEAAGYAVSADDRLAARLVRSTDGITWEPLPGFGPRIREALAVLNRETAPTLIRLPVEGSR